MFAAFNSLALSPAPGPRQGRVMRVIAVAVGGALSVLATSADGAHATERVPSKRVSYADLNLNSEAGRDTLIRRVRFAARHVCHQATFQTSLPMYVNRKCISATMAKAMSQVDRAIVLAELSQ